jgi:hypothetical protein
MQPSPQFNTHHAIKAIMATGLNEPQAEAVVNAIIESKKFDLETLATKYDLEKAKAEIIKWVFGGMFAITGIIIAAMEIIIR